MNRYLSRIIAEQDSGRPAGIYSVCSAHPAVLEAALEFGRDGGMPVLIESTSNQVNQFGGYTGMRPADFAGFIGTLRRNTGFPPEQLILGGDHLGPNPWRSEPAREAMEKACGLVAACVSAGYRKIHLDASMFLADDTGDRNSPLDPAIAAERTALLCRAAEDAAEAGSDLPCYVIGTEVPVPGGITGEDAAVSVTRSEDMERTLELTRRAFLDAGLDDAWKRAAALVVQPGVEYGDHEIIAYDRDAARRLVTAGRRQTGIVFEGHSTDYQTEEALSRMVEDGIAVLKVGPEVTFTYRQALFGLTYIGREMGLFEDDEPADVIRVLDEVMRERPEYWRDYYAGSVIDQRLKRKFSYSDRARYYWPQQRLKDSVERLFALFSGIEIPPPLLSQFLPDVYRSIRTEGEDDLMRPRSMLKTAVKTVCRKYAAACRMV